MIRCLQCDKTYPAELNNCPYCAFQVPEINGIKIWAREFMDAGGGFKPEYFKVLANLEAGNFWFTERNKLVIWALSKYFANFQSLLEVGCGTGFVLTAIADAFSSAKLVGSEIFISGLGYASERLPKANFIQMDARQIPYENEFDVVGAFDVIEHIKEDEVVLLNMFQAIRPGGVLILTVPQHEWLWSATDEYACHERRYSATDLHHKVESAGFQVVRSTSFVTSLLPAMFFSRLFQKKSVDKEFDAMSEFRLPHWLNVFFGKLLSLELALIKNGINFPVGGSRLIVARKPSNSDS